MKRHPSNRGPGCLTVVSGGHSQHFHSRQLGLPPLLGAPSGAAAHVACVQVASGNLQPHRAALSRMQESEHSILTPEQAARMDVHPALSSELPAVLGALIQKSPAPGFWSPGSIWGAWPSADTILTAHNKTSILLGGVMSCVLQLHCSHTQPCHQNSSLEVRA